MAKRNRYHDHVDPDYQRWGRLYCTFPGVEECARLILAGKTEGAWADIIHFELAENASEHLDEMIDAFNKHTPGDVALYMLMALETAALPDSVEFLSGVLSSGDERFESQAITDPSRDAESTRRGPKWIQVRSGFNTSPSIARP